MKNEDLLLCKDSPAFELWVCCFTARLSLLFTLHLKIASEKSSVPCNRKLGLESSSEPF